MIARFPQCASSLTQAAESPSTSRARARSGRPRKNGSSSSASALGSGSFDPDPVLMKANKATSPGPSTAQLRTLRPARGRARTTVVSAADDIAAWTTWASSRSASPAGPRGAASRSRSPPAAPISSTASPPSLRRRLDDERVLIDPSQREQLERLRLTCEEARTPSSHTASPR